MGRYTSGFDAPSNPLHRARWAALQARGRPGITFEPIRVRVINVYEGKDIIRSYPLSLPRVRFIERGGGGT